MRLNRYLALATGLSRRAADRAISDGRVRVNGTVAALGRNVTPQDKVALDKRPITTVVKSHVIMLNKPVGYVCSRARQGNKTIYDLLPRELRGLKPAGRLDKDSSGLLLLTNDGKLAHQLTHPSFQKQKVYEVEIDKPLRQNDLEKITKIGVDIGEKQLSQFQLQQLESRKQKPAKPLIPDSYFLATLTEGKNRQIRRTFATLGYTVTRLHRTKFGPYVLGELHERRYKQL